MPPPPALGICFSHTPQHDCHKSTLQTTVAGPTLNNGKKVEFFWKLSLNVVENVAKVVFSVF